MPAKLLKWYDANKRAMPWRALPGKKPNPYHVMVSEFMLQQTGVKTVVPYFKNFIKRWPRVEDLARARLESVRAAWAGLGYYRRAGFLHACAKAVVAKYQGKIPGTEAALITLPGIGPYAAAAIAAIAFGQKASVVDGNVERVIARIYALQETGGALRKAVTEKARALVPEQRCGDYAQAIMELGALICAPRSPACASCPWRENCRAFAEGAMEKYPIKGKAKATPHKYADVFVVEDKEGRLLLRQRAEAGLLGGMWEFPSGEWQEKKAKSTVLAGLPKLKWQGKAEIIHVFSHFTLHLRLRRGHAPTIFKAQDDMRWVAKRRLGTLALPTLMKKVFAAAESEWK